MFIEHTGLRRDCVVRGSPGKREDCRRQSRNAKSDTLPRTISKFSRHEKPLHDALLMQCRAVSATYVGACDIAHGEEGEGE
jgi:hypothetical protein